MTRTEGQRLLRKSLDARGAQRKLAKRIRRSEAQVSLWLSGQNLPDLEGAVLLSRELGIPPEAWIRKPRGGAREKTA